MRNRAYVVPITRPLSPVHVRSVSPLPVPALHWRSLASNIPLLLKSTQPLTSHGEPAPAVLVVLWGGAPPPRVGLRPPPALPPLPPLAPPPGLGVAGGVGV